MTLIDVEIVDCLQIIDIVDIRCFLVETCRVSMTNRFASNLQMVNEFECQLELFS